MKEGKRHYGKPLGWREKSPQYNAPPERWIKEIIGTTTVYLCDKCKKAEYTKCGQKSTPFILAEDYFRK